MQPLDLNLLVTLDALLSEGSVARAAARMGITPPAMSHALARLREMLGDPLLVRAGRALVPTPRAVAMRERVRAVVDEARSVLAAAEADLATLRRTFTVRANEASAVMLSGVLLRRLHSRAPLLRLRFAPEGEEDVSELRDGRIDLDIGAQGELGPEIKVQALFEDEYVGVVRRQHRLARGKLTAARYAAAAHVSGSRRGRAQGPVDVALAKMGLERAVAIVVPGPLSALAIAADSELVATVPASLARWGQRNLGLRLLKLPLHLPRAVMAQAWHPRLDVDPAHRWLRACLKDCAQQWAAPRRARPADASY
jgi:DNA-binding transcriptional LysR family regulator